MRPRVALVLPLFLFLSACFATFPIPGSREGETKYVFQGADIEILGPVSMTGEVVALLGYFIVGPDNYGYVALVDKAQRELGADTVIDVSVDRHALTVLGFFFGRIEWRATGTAIRYRDSLRGEPQPAASSLPTAVRASTEPIAAAATAPAAPPLYATVPQRRAQEQDKRARDEESSEPQGFSFGLRGAYGWPSGTYGEEPLSSTAIDYADVLESQIIPAWVDVGYRFDAHQYAGLYASLGLAERPCDFSYPAEGVTATTTLVNMVSDCETRSWRVGANWQYRFPIGASLAPWIGLGGGAEIVTLKQKVVPRIVELDFDLDEDTQSGTLSGFEVNLQGGLDFITAGSFGFGPFIAVTAGQYLNTDFPAPLDKVDSRDFHYWVFAGVRVVNR